MGQPPVLKSESERVATSTGSRSPLYSPMVSRDLSDEDGESALTRRRGRGTEMCEALCGSSSRIASDQTSCHSGLLLTGLH